MPYDLVWEPEGVHKRFSGFVTARQFIQSVEQTQRDSRFDEIHYIINDLSEITGHELSEQVLTHLAAINYGAYASNPNCRIVYVTTEDALVGRLKANLVSGEMTSFQVEVLPTVSDARDWLDSQPKLHNLSNVMGFRLG